MRKRLNYLAALACAMVLPVMPLALVGSGAMGLAAGCSTVAVNSDPVVVRAQQARDFLRITADAFFTFEQQNRAKLLLVSPDVKATADRFRRDVPVAIDNITVALTVYKAARTPQTGAAVETANAVASVTLGELQTEHAKAKVSAIN